MNSHSEKQSAILKTMGIDVWKQRLPANESKLSAPVTQSSIATPSNVDIPDQSATSSAAQPTISSNAEAVVVHDETTVIKENASDRKNKEPVTHNLDSVATAVQSTGAAVAKSDVNANVGMEIVDWRASVSRQTGAKWCFVYALSSDQATAENKLFEAMRFALGLSKSDCHVIEVIATAETFSESDAERGVKNSLSELIEEECPSNIVLLGEDLAQFLIETDKPLDVLRSESYRYQGGASSLYVTYGLQHLLTHPLDKLCVWQDLVKARKTISE